MTRVIRCADDAAGLDFLVLDDFLSGEACDRLAEIHAASSDRYLDPAEEFWRGRLLGYREVREVSALSAVVMRAAVNAAASRIAEFYGADAPLYPDVVHLVGWRPGQSMPPHADNANPDGTPHALAHRDFSGVVYLTDGYQGGELHLPQQDVLVMPRRGMLVSLPAGLSHTHAVTQLLSGNRITMAFFLTFEGRHADRDIFAPDPLA